VVGSIVQDGTTFKKGPPGHVRGFDVKTGKMKWIFHTIPQEGEKGIETWENESWKYTGSCNVWSMIASDNELGYVYLPTSTPTGDFFGGHRLGDNLFAESLVCLDAETGQRVWHFQCTHHGLWDYDLPTAPTLMDVTIDGQQIKAVAQVSKQGFTYAFDRVTGEPLWPIEEREVPASSVPGERASPTQPFPTKPPPFERQGVTDDDLIDLTSELRKEALAIVAADYTTGPIFTPPRTKDQGKPVIQLPGDGGGANWTGAAFDPESGQFYIPSVTTPKTLALGKPDPARSDLNFTPQGWTSAVRGPQGLPLVKPPYARITAIDMNAGDHTWMTPHGDGPRDHPAIKHLELGALGQAGFHAGGPLVTKTLLIVAHGGRDVDPTEGARRLSVYDKMTGEYLGSIPLPAIPYGNPITYLHNGKQWIAVAVGGGRFMIGGGGDKPELIGLALP
jgi:quinoprotein glucose dehydrogenase